MAKRSGRKRKYSRSAGREVKNEMHRYKRGKAKSGPGGGEEPQAGDRDRALEGAQDDAVRQGKSNIHYRITGEISGRDSRGLYAHCVMAVTSPAQA